MTNEVKILSTFFYLPFDIVVTRSEGGAVSVASDLRTELRVPSELLGGEGMKAGVRAGFVEGLEHFLAALAKEGVDLGEPAYARAIASAVSAFGKTLPELDS